MRRRKKKDHIFFRDDRVQLFYIGNDFFYASYYHTNMMLSMQSECRTVLSLIYYLFGILNCLNMEYNMYTAFIYQNIKFWTGMNKVIINGCNNYIGLGVLLQSADLDRTQTTIIVSLLFLYTTKNHTIFTGANQLNHCTPVE